MEKSVCGCINHEECCVCFAILCKGNYDNICTECLSKLKPTNGIYLHPTKRTPLLMCKCGKPWTNSCGIDTESTWYLDVTKLTKDTKKNRDIALNPSKYPSYYTQIILHCPIKKN